ncbi:hypothetical protein [Kibdelosporangium philippinense]
MAVRRRFKPAERKAFVSKTEVEWLNGSHWRPGVIVGSFETDAIGSPYIGVLNKGATRTIADGQYVRGYPGGIRLPEGVAAPGPSVSTDTQAASVHEEDRQAELF